MLIQAGQLLGAVLVLAAVAAAEQQWGFILFEGAWAVVSAAAPLRLPAARGGPS